MKLRNEISPETRSKINEFKKEVDQQWAFERRKEYLRGLIEELLMDYWYERDRIDDYVRRGRVTEIALVTDSMNGIIKKILRHQREIIERRKILEGKTSDRLTDDQIEEARNRNPRDFHSFDSRGWGLCLAHEDRHPSLHIYNNRLKCFSCQWEGDLIDFVMLKTGRPFAQAVRMILS